MDGIVLVDKPIFITSSDLVQKVKKVLKEKVGHTGTLDYAANGLMILTVGKGTRLTQFFQKLDKEYIATGKLGEITDTYDSQGKVVQTTSVEIQQEGLKKVVASFVGSYDQLPPPYSAKRIQGKRAYQLAKKGINPDLKPVRVHIHNIEILKVDIPFFTIKVSCSTGTYIRSLIKDIGDKVGCGAYMTELRRTKVGGFRVEEAVELDRLLKMEREEIERVVIPLEKALRFMEIINLTENYAKRFKHGQKFEVNMKSVDAVRVLDQQDNLIGIGRLEDGMLKPVVILG
ncbi:MAG: tRNA pseudouridine(55) synthase TruB [Hydrogenothermaceae bacterium]|nr:tRNA pseudouridine(55) synthase TruB [Hydrogenothermaceae bacterium]